MGVLFYPPQIKGFLNSIHGPEHLTMIQVDALPPLSMATLCVFCGALLLWLLSDLCGQISHQMVSRLRIFPVSRNQGSCTTNHVLKAVYQILREVSVRSYMLNYRRLHIVFIEYTRSCYLKIFFVFFYSYKTAIQIFSSDARRTGSHCKI